MAKYQANIWKMYLYRFLVSLFFIGSVMVPYYQEVGHLSFFQIMFIESLFVVGLFLFEIPTGAIADVLGRKYSLVLSTLLVFFASLLFAAFPTFWVFIGANMLWAASIALYSGAGEAFMYDSLKMQGKGSSFKTIFGKFMSMEHLGFVIAGPIGGYLAQQFGLRAPMWATVIPIIFAFLFTITLQEPKRSKIVPAYWPTIVKGVGYFKGHKVLHILAFDRISINVLTWIIFWMYQPLLARHGLPLSWYGWYYAAIFGIPVVLLRNLDFLEKLFGSARQFLFWSALVSSLSLLLIGVVDSVFPMTVFLLLYFSMNTSRLALLINYTNKHIPSPIRATVMSTISMIESICYFAGYLVAGVLVEQSLLGTFVVFGVYGLVCTFTSRVKEEHVVD